jgi:hypothetical protein
MPSLETTLSTLITKVSPGGLTLSIPRFAALRDESYFEVSVQTRSYDEVFMGKTVGEAIRNAHSSILDPSPGGEMIR